MATQVKVHSSISYWSLERGEVPNQICPEFSKEKWFTLHLQTKTKKIKLWRLFGASIGGWQ